MPDARLVLHFRQILLHTVDCILIQQGFHFVLLMDSDPLLALRDREVSVQIWENKSFMKGSLSQAGISLLSSLSP